MRWTYETCVQRFTSYGFKIIESCKDLNKDDTLYVTYCCSQKCDKQIAKVKDMYISSRCKSFFKGIQGYNAGIISEKYGLVLLEQEIENYNLGPKDLTESMKEDLRNKLKDQIKSYGKKNLVLFGAPMMVRGFISLLNKVEGNKYLCFGVNRLNDIPKKKEKRMKIQLKNKKLF